MVKITEQNTQQESPLGYFFRRAKDYGILDRVRANPSVGFSGPRIAAGIEGLVSEVIVGTTGFNHSEPSTSGIRIYSGEGMDAKVFFADGKAELFDPVYSFYFGISGIGKPPEVNPLSLRVPPDIEWVVRDLTIFSSSIREGTDAPASVFQQGQDYKPAVDWILERYVKVIHTEKLDMCSPIPVFESPKKQL